VQIQKAVNELQLQLAYHSDDYLLLRLHIDKLNQATLKLAELMMDSALRGALKGKQI